MNNTGSDLGILLLDSTHVHDLLGYPTWRPRQRVHYVKKNKQTNREFVMNYALLKFLVVNRVNKFTIYLLVGIMDNWTNNYGSTQRIISVLGCPCN